MNDTPLGVKIISILYYLNGSVSIIFGFLFLVAAKFLTKGALALIVFGIGAIVGVILIIVGIFSIFLGRCLWVGKSWARIIVIIFSGLGVLGSLGPLLVGGFFMLVPLAMHGAILGYLLASKEAKEYFQKS